MMEKLKMILGVLMGALAFLCRSNAFVRDPLIMRQNAHGAIPSPAVSAFYTNKLSRPDPNGDEETLVWGLELKKPWSQTWNSITSGTSRLAAASDETGGSERARNEGQSRYEDGTDSTSGEGVELSAAAKAGAEVKMTGVNEGPEAAVGEGEGPFPMGMSGAIQDDDLVKAISNDFGMMALLRSDKFKGLTVLLRNENPSKWVELVNEAYPDDDEVKDMLKKFRKLQSMMNYYAR